MDNERYYTVLEVPRSSSQEDIKRSHRRLALRHHPDKGGDPERFKEINEAYDVLKDEEKRQMYDDLGEEALKQGGGGGGGGASGMGDIFDMFMGGGGAGGGRRAGPRRSPDIVRKMAISLEDMFHGTTRKLAVMRNMPCEPCSGSGARSGRTSPCTRCKGSGTEVQVRSVGPGMVQHMQRTCGGCGGAGSSAPTDAAARCESCGGARITAQNKTFEVTVEPGVEDGARVVLHGGAGCREPGTQPGDMLLTLQQQEHAEFRRVSAVDLLVQRRILLAEALCGGRVELRHLDGRLIRLASPEGHVIRPDTVKCVVGEGMPRRGAPSERGNLYVHYQVVFPARIDATATPQLRRLLQPATPAAGTGVGTPTAGKVAAGKEGADREADGEEGADREDDVSLLRTVADLELELRPRRRETQHTSPPHGSPNEAQRVQCAQS